MLKIVAVLAGIFALASLLASEPDAMVIWAVVGGAAWLRARHLDDTLLAPHFGGAGDAWPAAGDAQHAQSAGVHRPWQSWHLDPSVQLNPWGPMDSPNEIVNIRRDLGLTAPLGSTGDDGYENAFEDISGAHSHRITHLDSHGVFKDEYGNFSM